MNTNNKKYIFFSLEIINGEYNYFDNQIACININEDTNEFVNNFALNYYPDNNVRQDEDMFYFYNDTITVYINDYKEISEEDYNVLSKYI